MISQKLEIILNNAIKTANELKHEYLTLEAVLLSMLEDEQVCYVLEECGTDIGLLRSELEEFISNSDNFSILSTERIEELSKKQFIDEEVRMLARQSGIFYQPEISLSLQRVIQRAALHVQSAGKKDIRGINILVAIYGERESFAVYSLEKQGIERLKVVEFVSHGLDQAVNTNNGPEDGEETLADGLPKQEKKKSFLEEYTINLNQQAADGMIDPIIGRSDEIRRIVQILCRRRKNNPLLVGEAGVGKTALAEGLALAIIKDEVPEVLRGTIVYSLDMAQLLAGAKFRGDFEERLKGVVKEIEKMHKNGQKTVLFIDEMHTVMGAGSTSGGSMDASNILKPSLSKGIIRCMGSTTHEEYRKFIEKDQAFNRRFQKIDIDEPTIEETYQILLGLKQKFEEHHEVKFSPAVIRSVVDLAARYLSERKNPDKSIDIMDEVGAMNQLLPKSKRKTQISKKDVEEVVAKLAKIPAITVVQDEREKLASLKENLSRLIFGQEEAVEQVTKAIWLSRSGLGAKDRPQAAFLFAGPTGVGKTELARVLARELGMGLERFDMSEYMEKHSVAKLIGAPPGYVGFESGGLLTDAVKKRPSCILLLDEIEKAHPDVTNILLQVLDHGVLSDSHGRQTDFRNTIIILTTNAGAREASEGSIGLSQGPGLSKNENTSKRDKVLKNFFAPEFRNRLDAIIHFKSISEEVLIQIVDKFLAELEQKLVEKNVHLTVKYRAKAVLARFGYEPKMGARPLSRLIDQKIKSPLSTEVLFGKLAKGGGVEVDLKDDLDAESKVMPEFKFTFSEIKN